MANMSNINQAVPDTISKENYHLRQTEILSAKTLIAVAILFLYTISSPIMHKFKFYVLHESGMSMIIGLTITICAMIFNPETTFANTLYFDDAVFFNFILPPIIFSAGYNLKRKSFFKYIVFTLFFGVLGTIISFLIIASFSFGLNYIGAFSSDSQTLDLSIQEILLFSCIISSTDTLAALTFVKEENDSKLFSILFGEGVFNDAVSIVLYKIITDFAYSKQEFTSKTPIWMFGSFLKLFLVSLIFGLIVGLICTLFLKKMKRFKLHRVQECSIIIFFAFFSYTISALLGLSPIISLLFSAMFMSHYSFYNLSFQAREESSIVSKIMSNIAEAFVFTYLGLTFISMSHASFSLSFLIFEFVIVIFARYSSVYSLSCFINIFNQSEYIIKPSERGIMAFAGSIRGAIAFGLAISIQTGSVQNDEILVSTTLIMVFVSTIIFGAMLPLVIKYYRQVDINMMVEPSREDERLLELEASEALKSVNHHKEDVYSHGTFEYTYSHPNNRFDIDLKSDEEVSICGMSKSSLGVNHMDRKEITFIDRMKHYWYRFDNDVIKPWLLHNWPHSKFEHEEITIKIKNLFSEHKKNKFANRVKINVQETNNEDDYEGVDVSFSCEKGDRDNDREENDKLK